jgi:hypothetical protein
MADSLSLAVMVKNDAERLRRCLSSMQDYADEIVVLDTGSTDESVSVAKEFGARIQQIEWPNDFAAALNVLLSMITTDWLFRMDSDEWIEPDQAKLLRHHIREPRVSAYTVIRKDLTSSDVIDETDILRLWRAHPHLRYHGVVHETISREDMEQAWPGKVMLRSEITFWHDGYVGQQLDEKSARNLDLLRIDAQQRPDNFEVRAMLATALFGMKQPDGAEHMEQLMDAFLAAPSLPQGSPQVAQAIVIYLETLPLERVQEERTSRLVEKAVSKFAKNPVVLFYAAIIERKRENWDQALLYLLQMETIVTNRDYDRSMSIPAPFLGERMWKALGFVATKLGREEIVHRCRLGLVASQRQ